MLIFAIIIKEDTSILYIMPNKLFYMKDIIDKIYFWRKYWIDINFSINNHHKKYNIYSFFVNIQQVFRFVMLQIS